MKNLTYNFVFILLFFSGSTLRAQNTYDDTRPKIGVVLSGGGAKGIAHIGILKAMEEEGLYPDYIAGTSMGSIIGGLYATGYSADQLDSIVREIDWDLVLSNNIPLDYISFQEKVYYNRYLVEFPIKKGKLTLPSGMIEGQELSQVLTNYTWPSMKYESFDDFPIPFRCVATDVSTGNPIVFKDGSLSEALRASMSIPTAFTAADLDTTLAVDGGIVNNFPVEELFKMGADIVIGVNVSDEGLINAKELGSMTGILMQIAMTPSLKRVQEQIAMCDVYIKPDLKNYGTASFSSYKEILKLGYQAGEENREKFRKLAQSLNLKKREIKGIPFKVQPIVVSEIILQGNKLVDHRLILGKLDVQEGDTVTREEIETGINKVYGVNLFKKVLYQIEKVPNRDEYDLYVKLAEKQPVTLKASVHYDNLFSAGIVINLTVRELLGRSSRFIVEGDISKNPKARISYLKYLGGRERFAGITGYSFLDEEIPSYSDGKVEDVSVSRQHIFSAGLLTTQSLKQSIYAGLSYEMDIEKLKFDNILPAEIKNADFDYFKAKLIYTNNTTDNRNYPTKGREILFLGDLFMHNKYYITFNNPTDSVLGLSEKELDEYYTKPMTPDVYGMAQFKFYEFIHLSKNFQLIPAASVGVTIGTNDDGIFDNFRIGGMQLVKIADVSFMGLNFDEISDQNYLIGGLYLQNVLFRNLFLKYGANFLLYHNYVPINDLSRFDFNNMIDENSILGFGLKMTYKSPLGPISFGLAGNTNDPVWRTYFAVGFSFNYKD